MAEITIRGQTYVLDLFKGLEGNALDEKLLEINGVGAKTLPKVRETVLSALADEAGKTAAECRNFEKCGNHAEEGHAYCTGCHLKWRKEQISREDRETRPQRVNAQERLKKAHEFYARYYKSGDWPQEVREAFLAAEAAIAEGDRLALEAMDENDPNPGLFKGVRWNYFQVRNHLSVASYHSARISAKGVLKGLSNFVQRRLQDAMREAEKAMREADELEGYKKTRQLQNASRAMRDALSTARKERTSINKVEADDFYGGPAIGDFLSDDQVRKLNRQHKRREQKAKARRS
ncbi:MAG: hypothetical protein BMS9Abin34_244 [Patescibacteria group bacterium]|nr:MAG: hypothetical protein BMS9Abin34_244 [Patescibacteria group bacterium]